MKDFLKLVKAIEASNLVVNRKKNGKTVKPHSFGISIVLTAVILTLTFLYQFYGLLSIGINASASMDVFRSLFQLSLTSYSLYGFFMCVVFAFSVFFRSRDDIFLSMPISGGRFFLAKLVLTLYLNLVYGGLTILTTGICLCVMLKLSFLAYFSVVVVFLTYVVVTPCLAFLVTDFFSLFVNLKTSRMPSVILQSVFGGLAGLCAMLVSFISSSFGDNPTAADFASVVEKMSGMFSWCDWLGYFQTKAVMSDGWGDMLYLLIHMVISFALVMATILVARRTYFTNLGKTYSSKKKKMDARKNEKNIQKAIDGISNQNRILLKKELSNYKDDKTVLVNGFIFPLTSFLSFFSVALALYLSGVFDEKVWGYQLICLSCAIASMPFYLIPFSSMSMERQNISFMKSLPVSLNKIMGWKLWLCLLMILPVSTLFGLTYLFLAPFSLDFLFALLALTFLFPVLMVVYSFYIGVRFPNFNAGNASELMKKGAGPNLCLIGHFVFVVLVTGIMVFSSFVFHHFIYGALIAGILLALLIVVFYVLGRKRLNHLLNSEIF